MNSFSLEYDIKKPSSYNQNTKVILMFHGYGSNKSDLFSFSNFMDSDYLIISIQAPIKLDYNSYCWWSLQYDDNMRLTMNAEEALKTVNQLDEFISTDLCEKYNFISDQIYLVGFSQGCMISYTLSINYPKKYKKVITRTKRFAVHDSEGVASMGDQVRIRETRPISKTKNWVLISVLRKSTT